MVKRIDHHSATRRGVASRSAYVQGCRCEECTMEQRLYARARRGGLIIARPVPPEVAELDILIQQAIDAGDDFTVRALSQVKEDLIAGI